MRFLRVKIGFKLELNLEHVENYVAYSNNILFMQYVEFEKLEMLHVQGVVLIHHSIFLYFLEIIHANVFG